MRPLLGLLYSLCCVLLLTQGQGVAGQYAPAARDNPFGFIAALSKMPPEQQRQYLNIIGENMKQQNHLPCNPYGGAEACMSLPSDSKFAKACPQHDLKVDCAYYSEDLQEINNNPVEDVEHQMDAVGMGDLRTACPQCFENQKAMWCAQTVPKCGSFQNNVELAILPAIEKVVSVEEEGRNYVTALGEVVPGLLRDMALGGPCREMCEAVVGTCSCQRDRKFGELLDKVYQQQTQGMEGMELPPGFTRDMFGELYDQPLCSLYLPKATPGFSGHCDALPAACTSAETWCHGYGDGNPGPDMVEELMALQLAKGLFGWMDNPGGGLYQEEQEMIDDADNKDVADLEKDFIKEDDSHDDDVDEGLSTASIVGIALLAVAMSAVLAFGAFVAYSRVRQARRTEAEGYISMIETNEAATYAPPVGRVPDL